jgi:hypothetical protein
LPSVRRLRNPLRPALRRARCPGKNTRGLRRATAPAPLASLHSAFGAIRPYSIGMPKVLGLALLLVAALAALAGGANAATLLAADLAQLVRMSDYVVLAKAESRVSRKQESSGLIVTDVKLRVQIPLKGSTKAGETLTATLLGGSIGAIGLHVPGEAHIPEDRGAIVFLRRASNGELNVSGMGQGVMSITGQGDAAMVMPAAPDAALVQPDATGKLEAAPQAVPAPQPLATLLQRIRELAAATR